MSKGYKDCKIAACHHLLSSTKHNRPFVRSYANCSFWKALWNRTDLLLLFDRCAFVLSLWCLGVAETRWTNPSSLLSLSSCWNWLPRGESMGKSQPKPTGVLKRGQKIGKLFNQNINAYRPAQPRNTDHRLHKGQWSISKFCLYGRGEDLSVVGNIHRNFIFNTFTARFYSTCTRIGKWLQ